MYRALRECKFDRKYSYGECIPDSVADQGCFANAINFGYIEKVEPVKEPVEALKASERDSAKEVEEDNQQKRKGRKKADRGV